MTAYQYGASRKLPAPAAIKDELARLETAKLEAELRIKRAEVARAEREAMEAEKRAQRDTNLDYERAVAFSRTLPAPLHGGSAGLRQAVLEIEAFNRRKAAEANNRTVGQLFSTRTAAAPGVEGEAA